jgi:hypothetical protein
MSSYPGFEAFSEVAQESSILRDAIRLNLNKDLGGLALIVPRVSLLAVVH